LAVVSWLPGAVSLLLRWMVKAGHLFVTRTYDGPRMNSSVQPRFFHHGLNHVWLRNVSGPRHTVAGPWDDAMPGSLSDTGIACAYWTKSVPPMPGTEPVAVDRARARRGPGKSLKNRGIAEPSGIKTS
jgi:peptidoglycan/xylan/chitin deacetylase (PgdA/CDA1 family)